jgi:hypothetical protein
VKRVGRGLPVRGIIARGVLAAALLAGWYGAAQAQAPVPSAVEAVAVSPQGVGRWLRAESDHVIVYSDENAEILRRTVEDLEVLDQTLRAIYGKPSDPTTRKFPIYLVRPVARGSEVNEVYQRFLPGATTGSLSMDVATTDDIFAVVVRDNFHFFGVTDATAGDDSVLCAYAYHFFSENFAFRQPRWLTKGAAIYYSAIDIRPDSVVVGATPALFDDARMIRNLGGMPGLIAEAGDDRADPNRYDARSALLVRYLWTNPDRKARLASYLDRLEAGDRDPKTTCPGQGRPADRHRADGRGPLGLGALWAALGGPGLGRSPWRGQLSPVRDRRTVGGGGRGGPPGGGQLRQRTSWLTRDPRNRVLPAA